MPRPLRWCLWLLVSIAMLEVALRATLDANRLYSRFHTVPEYNQWRNQVRFWTKFHDFENLDELAATVGYDSQLGWDYEVNGDRIRGAEQFSASPNPGITRVVALGDSYVYGFELDHEQTFSAILTARDNNIEVLNMGVPGYGIDQALLKYRHHGAAYQPQVVLLAIYTTDYERSSIDFSFYAKPRYVEIGGNIVLTNVPVPLPQAELLRIAQAMQGRIYLAELIRNLLRKAQHSSAADDAYYNQTDTLVKHMLSQLRHSLLQHQQLLVLHIPNADSLIDPDNQRSELDRRLLNIYAELGLDHINLADAFVDTLTAQQAYATYYIAREDGSAGHLNHTGHKKIAELISARLQPD